MSRSDTRQTSKPSRKFKPATTRLLRAPGPQVSPPPPRHPAS
jgi:hypothetical protein